MSEYSLEGITFESTISKININKIRRISSNVLALISNILRESNLSYAVFDFIMHIIFYHPTINIR